MTNQEIGRSLASSFVEMAAALDKLPQVEADLDRAKGRVEFLEAFNNDLNMEVIKLKGELASAEAALANATKSGDGHRANVDLMLQNIREVLGQLHVVTDLVDPPPPVVVPEPEVVDLPRPPISTQQDDVGGDSWASGAENTPSPFAPGILTSGSSPSSAAGSIEATTGGQSEVNPTATVASEAETIAAPTTSSAPTTDVNTSPSNSGQSETNPTAGPIPSTATAELSSGTSTPNDGTSTSPPPKPYWLKPSNMKWEEWRDDHHGDVPAWVMDGKGNIIPDYNPIAAQ